MTADAAFLLQDERRRAGLTQGELAERAGLNQSTICRYESGEYPLTFGELDRLLRCLGRRLDLRVRPAEKRPQVAVACAHQVGAGTPARGQPLHREAT